MNSLSDCRLYVILDTGYAAGDRLLEMARAVIRGGADIIQVRAKKESDKQVLSIAGPVLDVAKDAGIPLIINDRPLIARKLGAAGAHVGQDDMSVKEARRLLNKGQWVGKSTHSVQQIKGTLAEAPDYIGVGPVYATPTKPDYVPVGLDLVKKAALIVTTPFFCIGGIKLENVDEVLAAGATRIVVVSGILLASDPENYTKKLKSKLKGLPT